jgi:hypothetical protein
MLQLLWDSMQANLVDPVFYGGIVAGFCLTVIYSLIRKGLG